ncbi:MAG: D-alanine--D-alanine ligase [Candidatus Omnitrophica bacterium]|nr:D-alanine--D-alanine ligase [Candidatus Omnitrophota bacterium]
MDRLKQYKIAVLAGGASTEREVSLKSGAAVFNALKGAGVDVKFVDLTEESFGKIGSLGIDLAFLALHGKYGEDGFIQGLLKENNIIFTGSDKTASNLALDKIRSKYKFVERSVSTPGFVVVKRNEKVDARNINVPCVVKPQFEGSSIGIAICETKDDAVKAVLATRAYDGDALVEEYIGGRELTVGILDEKALPVVEIVPEDGYYDFHSKYLSGKTKYIVPAQLDGSISAKAQDLAIRAHKALGCKHMSRVDIRLDDKNDMYVLEVNTIPGFTEKSLLPMAAKAAGITFPELCRKILIMAIDESGAREYPHGSLGEERGT